MHCSGAVLCDSDGDEDWKSGGEIGHSVELSGSCSPEVNGDLFDPSLSLLISMTVVKTMNIMNDDNDDGSEKCLFPEISLILKNMLVYALCIDCRIYPLFVAKSTSVPGLGVGAGGR